MFKQKLFASLVHLALSALLIMLLVGSTLFFFFPSLFISVSDFKEVATLIVSIDLVLGPLLTFVVYKPKKKTLKFDLGVIASIQISALAYGIYALYQVHPVYVTFNVDRFTIVSAKDADPKKAKFNEYKISKLSAGKLAYAQIPDQLELRNDLLVSSALGGEDLDQREEYYEPYHENISKIIAKSLDPKLIFSNEEAKRKAKKFLSRHSDLDLLAFLPLNSLKKDAIIVLDKKTAEPVATLDIDPWSLKLTKKSNQ